MNLLDLFSRKKNTEFVQCFFCKTEVPGNKSFQLTYQAKDGAGTVKMCEPCATEFENIKRSM